MRSLLAVATLAALMAPAPSLAAWEVLRKDANVTLSIEPASIKRSGSQVSFQYLVDYTKPQADFKAGVAYRSLVVKAIVRCQARMMALGNTDVFSEPAGKGTNLGTMFPDRIESTFGRIEANTSDEDLWKRVCGAKAPATKK